MSTQDNSCTPVPITLVQPDLVPTLLQDAALVLLPLTLSLSLCLPGHIVALLEPALAELGLRTPLLQLEPPEGGHVLGGPGKKGLA